MLHFCPGSDRPDEFQDCGGSGFRSRTLTKTNLVVRFLGGFHFSASRRRMRIALLCSLETQMGKDGAQRRDPGSGGKSYIQFVLRGGRNVNGAVGPHPMVGTY